MTYICEYCESVVEDNEVEVVREWLTENYWETVGICPHCHRDELVEAEQCERCGEWYRVDEISEGVCEGCREELIKPYRSDAKKVYNVTSDEDEKINLNAFLATMFSRVEIENILLKVLEDAKADCSKFIDNDSDWFLAKIKENGGEI